MQNNCTYGSPLKHTNIKINIMTKALRTDKDQCTRDMRSIDFNEDLNLWRELKLVRSPGRLFHIM